MTDHWRADMEGATIVPKIGLAGLDRLGRAIAARLVGGPFRALGYDADLSRAATSGVRSAASLEQLLAESNVVLVTASGPDARACLDAIAASGRAGRPAILAGWLEPAAVQEVARAMRERGIPFLDAPVGSPLQVVERQEPAIFVSGDQALFDRWLALFQTIGRPHFVGEAGRGQVARLANLLLYWSGAMAAVDAFTLVE
ncbi:MAG: NAD(P)-binding domain-containing protein, partial [Chloroflexota bacterium]